MKGRSREQDRVMTGWCVRYEIELGGGRWRQRDRERVLRMNGSDNVSWGASGYCTYGTWCVRARQDLRRNNEGLGERHGKIGYDLRNGLLNENTLGRNEERRMEVEIAVEV